MNRVAKVFLTSASVLFVAGCAGTELEKAERVSPEGSMFDVTLYQEYLDLASSEFNEGDYKDSDKFAIRAVQSGTGGMVGPEQISDRKLPEDKVEELTSARERLVDTLSKGAAQKLPAETARAQTSFDCWMQEQEENFQFGHIEACRSSFYTTLVSVEDALKPVPVAMAVEPEVEPPVEPSVKDERYVVYFDFDKASFSEASMVALEAAIGATQKRNGMTVTVGGHTDRAGTSDYNVGLSEQRAQAVSDALVSAGVMSAAVKLEAYGESQPAVMTADGVAEPANRRVEILIGTE
jgi:OOP family OmpA-OmpF porin